MSRDPSITIELETADVQLLAELCSIASTELRIHVALHQVAFNHGQIGDPYQNWESRLRELAEDLGARLG